MLNKLAYFLNSRAARTARDERTKHDAAIETSSDTPASAVEVADTTNAPDELRDDVLAQQIARAHGWLHTGARIRDQIAHHLRRLERTQETSSVFVWQSGTVSSRFPFRQPQNEGHRRLLSDICLPELVDFIPSHSEVLDEADPPLVYARLLQLERLTASSRERLEEAIASALAL